MKKLIFLYALSFVKKINFSVAIFMLINLLTSVSISQQLAPIVSNGPLQLGQSVVTSFQDNVPGYHVVRVVDIRNRAPFIIGGAEIFPNQFAGPDWTQSRMGNVFGIALDDSPNPNIYVARSTVYCGANNEPAVQDTAIVYRLDGGNWGVSTYVRYMSIPGPPQANVNWIPNTGCGIGNLCYDKWHKQIFLTNHEDGTIYRVKDNAGVGQVVSWFDPSSAPFAPDDRTVGFAPKGERLWGIGSYGTNANDVKVYFGRWRFDVCEPNTANEYNEIWSVALAANGDFIPASLKREIKLPLLLSYTTLTDSTYSNPVSDIEFSFDGDMLCSERSMCGNTGVCFADGTRAHRSRILEYPRDISGNYSNYVWHKVGMTIAGYSPFKNNSAGGVDFEYGTTDSLSNLTNDCDSIIIGTGDYLFSTSPPPPPFNTIVYGLQETERSSAGTVNVQDFSYFIDITGALGVQDKGMTGDVDVYRKDLCSDTNTCMTLLRDTTYCDSTGTYIYEFQIRNNSYTKFIEQLEIAVDSPQPPNYVVAMPSTINVNPPLPPRSASQVYRVKLIGPGAVAYTEVCYTLSAQFLHDDCPWCCYIENCIKLPICSCAEVLVDSIYCNNGDYFYKFQLQNGTQYNVTKVQLTSPGINPVTFVPQTFHFGTPILPGQIFPVLTAQMLGGAAGITIPVRIKLFSDDFECCYFELTYTLPPCDTLILNLKSFIEGRYNPATNLMYGCDIEVELRNNYPPYALVETAAGYLNDSGNCSLKYFNAENGTNYYIVLKHNNTLETWSKSPGQSFSGDVLNFNFLSNTQAYGSNLGLIDSSPLRFGIMAGDIDQDGQIDLTDIVRIFNESKIFGSGVSDLNGDGITDLTDLVIVYNNAQNYASVVSP